MPRYDTSTVCRFVSHASTKATSTASAVRQLAEELEAEVAACEREAKAMQDLADAAQARADAAHERYEAKQRAAIALSRTAELAQTTSGAVGDALRAVFGGPGGREEARRLAREVVAGQRQRAGEAGELGRRAVQSDAGVSGVGTDEDRRTTKLATGTPEVEGKKSAAEETVRPISTDAGASKKRKTITGEKNDEPADRAKAHKRIRELSVACAPSAPRTADQRPAAVARSGTMDSTRRVAAHVDSRGEHKPRAAARVHPVRPGEKTRFSKRNVPKVRYVESSSEEDEVRYVASSSEDELYENRSDRGSGQGARKYQDRSLVSAHKRAHHVSNPDAVRREHSPAVSSRRVFQHPLLR